MTSQIDHVLDWELQETEEETKALIQLLKAFSQSQSTDRNLTLT